MVARMLLCESGRSSPQSDFIPAQTFETVKPVYECLETKHVVFKHPYTSTPVCIMFFLGVRFWNSCSTTRAQVKGVRIFVFIHRKRARSQLPGTVTKRSKFHYVPWAWKNRSTQTTTLSFLKFAAVAQIAFVLPKFAFVLWVVSWWQSNWPNQIQTIRQAEVLAHLRRQYVDKTEWKRVVMRSSVLRPAHQVPQIGSGILKHGDVAKHYHNISQRSTRKHCSERPPWNWFCSWFGVVYRWKRIGHRGPMKPVSVTEDPWRN